MTEFADVKNSDVCMVDGKVITEGYKVDENDPVIKLIRALKERFMVARHNRLYVCKDHYEAYLKKRKSYERIVLLVAGLLAFLFIFGILLPLFSGTFSWFALVSFFMIAFVMVFLMLFLHVPKVGNKLIVLKSKKSSTVSSKKSNSKTVHKKRSFIKKSGKKKK